MWNTEIETLREGELYRYEIVAGKAALTYREVISLMHTSEPFRDFFNRTLAQSPSVAFRWETPAVTNETFDRKFEFVLLRCEQLARPVDSQAFAKQFITGQPSVTFANLGRDATLVVPCPIGPNEIYGHLASFVRHAPPTQTDQLWKSVADAMLDRIDDRPVWLSTAGMGIAWLHIRLDDRPKYYGYREYR